MTLEHSAVIYARVSSEKQGEADRASIPEQLKACRDLAERAGYTVVNEYIDRERYKTSANRTVEPSGTRTDRPALTEMLAGAGKEWTVCIAWAQDRLARGSVATIYVRDRIEASRCQIKLVTGGWDSDTAELMGAVGGYELRRIKQRMALGRKGRVEKGLHIGEPPFGYKVVRDVNGKNVGYELIEAEAECLCELADLYLRHLSVNEIGRRLGLNPRTGKRWLSSTLQYILHNPFYYGEIVYGRNRPEGEAWTGVGVHPLAWTDLITAAMKRELERRRELYRRGPRRSKHQHLFAGVVRCAYCGRPMAGQIQRENKQHKLFLGYRCNTRQYQLIGNTDHDEHAPNHISETKLLREFKRLLQSLSPSRLKQLVVTTRAPERAALDKTKLKRRETQLSERESELTTALDTVRAMKSAANAISIDLERTRDELAEIRSKLSQRIRPAVAPDLAASALELQHILSQPNPDPQQLRQLIVDTIGVLYVAGGKLAMRPRKSLTT